MAKHYQVATQVFASLIAMGVIAGCSKGNARTFDLNALEGKVSAGMNEVQVTQIMGVPSSIKTEGDYRELRYDGQDGKGYIVVGLKGNVVIDARRR